MVLKKKPTYKVHEKTHTQEKAFSCGYCDQYFPNKKKKRIHEKKVHKAELKTDGDEWDW